MEGSPDSSKETVGKYVIDENFAEELITFLRSHPNVTLHASSINSHARVGILRLSPDGHNLMIYSKDEVIRVSQHLGRFMLTKQSASVYQFSCLPLDPKAIQQPAVDKVKLNYEGVLKVLVDIGGSSSLEIALRDYFKIAKKNTWGSGGVIGFSNLNEDIQRSLFNLFSQLLETVKPGERDFFDRFFYRDPRAPESRSSSPPRQLAEQRRGFAGKYITALLQKIFAGDHRQIFTGSSGNDVPYVILFENFGILIMNKERHHKHGIEIQNT